MNITQFQALNVVRTYNRQLRVGSFPKDEMPAKDTGQTDVASFSDEARTKLRNAQPGQNGQGASDSSRAAEGPQLSKKGSDGAVFQPKLPFR